MFSEKERRITVSLTLTDGTELIGDIPVGHAGNLGGELNRDGAFLGFRDASGDSGFILKTAIMKASTVEPLKEAKLHNLSNGMDPYKVLKVTPEADSASIREAYMDLVRQYHPDNFSGPNVPTEISEYVTSMFQQINAAHNAIKSKIPEAA